MNNPEIAMSGTIKSLEEIFDKLNTRYFEGKLPHPVITVQSTPKAYGHCSTKKIWKDNESEGQYEINIGAEYINRPTEETCATLCHEMVHLYCLENQITDTCQGGRYHNGKFKEEAEKRDLCIEYNRTIGWSITKPTDAFKQSLTDAGVNLQIKFARALPKASAAIGTVGIPGAADIEPKIRAKSWKYICPGCGQTVRSTNESLNLICGICKVTLERH